jgi:hypothetical protein
MIRSKIVINNLFIKNKVSNKFDFMSLVVVQKQVDGLE